MAAGLKDGFSLRSTFNGNTFTPPGDSSSVRNEYSYQYGSAVTLLKATADSINTAFVDLTTSMDKGSDKVAKMAQAAGAPKGAGWDLNSRIPLGTAEVSPLAQAGAYATFANGGTHVSNHVVKEVRDASGNVLYRAQPKETRAVSGDIADDVTYALSNVVEQGTGRAVQTLNRPVAGKTGTKDRENADGSGDIVSAWFVAYTKQISTAVMYVAGDDGNGDLDAYARPGDSTFFGGTYPALTWADYMEVATDGQPVKQFDPPAYVNGGKVSTPPPRTSEPTQTSQPTEKPTEQPSPTATATQTTDRDGDRDDAAERQRHVACPLDEALRRILARRRQRGAERPTLRWRRVSRAALARDAPSRSDGFVTAVSHRLGGPLGRHAGPHHSWWNPLRVALAVGTVVYLAGVVFRLPCRHGADHFKNLCYSDIGILYGARGLLQGNVPYLDSGDYPALEYPVLTGWFLELERRITALLGGAQGADLTPTQSAASTSLFVDINTVLLGALLLVAIWAQVRSVEPRPWDAMMVAASPCVAAASLINWDLLPIALTALGLMFWSRRRPGWAGVMLGLGMAAKLYPALLLGPLLVLCLRARRMPDFLTALSTFALSWAAVNLPALVLAPAAWRSFWQFNSERTGDLGSIWYVLSLAGRPVESLNAVSAGLFALACVAIAVLIALAPRRPRLGAMAFLVVAAFLMTNKVYSPQYMLWLLPLVALARPRWRDWLIFTAGELGYWVAIWWHLGGFLAPGDGSADRIYWLAVLGRLGTQGWLVASVVRDALRPEEDPVRRDGLDDPGGGVLDDAPDAPWWPRLRPRVADPAYAPRRSAERRP